MSTASGAIPRGNRQGGSRLPGSRQSGGELRGGELRGHELPIGGSALQCLLADAAIDLFYRQGALATTVREITSACGLTPGALYNHFASKEDLLYLAVRDIHLRLERSVTDAQRAAAGDPAAELATIVRVYVAMSSGSRQRSRVANREYQLLTGERRAEIVAIRRRLRDRLADVLLAGRRQGLFDLVGGGANNDGADDGRADATLTAVTIGAMCANVSDWAQERHPLSVDELRDRYAEMALRLAGARL
jgi:TetR/AcrR family transcriptional regulator, cholesterol catabolism regulator